MKFLFSNKKKYMDIGLLVMRVGIGVIFIKFGWEKINAGSQKWLWLGSQMAHLGITFAPVFWGFKAACLEFFGGLSLVSGFFTRLGALGIAGVMFVAIIMHLKMGDSFQTIAFPLSLLCVMVGLVFAGGGSYSLDDKFFR